METETPTKPTRTRTPKVATTEPATLTKRDFGNIANMFEGETPEVQTTFVQTSGMLQLIKLNLKEQAAVISWIVRNKYPTISEDEIFGKLNVGSIVLRSAISRTDLSGILTGLQGFAAELSDQQWNIFWHGMFCAISAPLLPFAKVVMYSEFVYQVLVKPNIK